VNKYLRHAALSVQETLAYRVAYLVNMVSTVVTYLVVFLIWLAVYAGRGSVGGFGWEEMKSYLTVSLFMSALVSGSSEYRTSRAIRSGNIAVELMRPVDFQKASLAITLGSSLCEGVLVSAACLGFAFAFGVSVFPSGPLQWLGFALAVCVAVAIKFLLVYVFGLACFWTQTLMGISWMRKGLTDFFSGALVPLSFFPLWLGRLADWLPFKSVVWVPASAFTGRLAGLSLARSLVVGVAWVVGLWLLSRAIWGAAMRRVTVQGG